MVWRWGAYWGERDEGPRKTEGSGCNRCCRCHHLIVVREKQKGDQRRRHYCPWRKGCVAHLVAQCCAFYDAKCIRAGARFMLHCVRPWVCLCLRMCVFNVRSHVVSHSAECKETVTYTGYTLTERSPPKKLAPVSQSATKCCTHFTHKTVAAHS